MWFLHIKNETKWFITDIDHQNRLLKDTDYEVIEEVEKIEEQSPTLDLDTLEYKELQALAKSKGLKHSGIKKEDLLKSLEEGE